MIRVKHLPVDGLHSAAEGIWQQKLRRQLFHQQLLGRSDKIGLHDGCCDVLVLHAQRAAVEWASVQSRHRTVQQCFSAWHQLVPSVRCLPAQQLPVASWQRRAALRRPRTAATQATCSSQGDCRQHAQRQLTDTGITVTSSGSAQSKGQRAKVRRNASPSLAADWQSNASALQLMPSSETSSSGLEALGRAQQLLEAALQLLQDPQRQACPPTAATHQTMLRALLLTACTGHSRETVISCPNFQPDQACWTCTEQTLACPKMQNNPCANLLHSACRQQKQPPQLHISHAHNTA